MKILFTKTLDNLEKRCYNCKLHYNADTIRKMFGKRFVSL